MTRRLQRHIFAACRELGMDTQTRHDMQFQATGKASTTDMSEAELRLVIDRLKENGWKPRVKEGVKRGLKQRHKRASRGDLRLVHVLWRLLGDAGCLRDPSRRGLNAFIRSRFENTWVSVPIDIDALRDAHQIAQLVTALKDWCRREGVELRK